MLRKMLPSHAIIAVLLLIAAVNILQFFSVEKSAVAASTTGNWAAVRLWEDSPLFQDDLLRLRYQCYVEIAAVAPGVRIVGPRDADSRDLTRRGRTGSILYGLGRAKKFKRVEYDPRRLDRARLSRYVVSESQLYFGPRMGLTRDEARRRLRDCRIAVAGGDVDTLYFFAPRPREIWFVDERLLTASERGV